MKLSREIPDEFIQILESISQIRLLDANPRRLKPLAASVASLAKNLKRDEARGRFTADSYLDDAETRLAYLLYYSTANLLRIHHPLDEITTSGFFHRSTLKVLDLGSGTGTMLAGLELWLRDHQSSIPRHFTAVDRSEPALKIAKELLDHLAPGQMEVVIADLTDLNKPAPRLTGFDLITAGNVLNELPSDRVDVLSDFAGQAIVPDGFFIAIEPALQSTSRRLLEFRNRLLTRGWFVYAPCFTTKPCPALADPEDWCHHAMTWRRPEFMAILDEMVGHVKKSLKFSYMVFTKQNRHLADGIFGCRDFTTQFRAVSESFKEKGRRRIFLCNDCGRLEFMKNKRDTGVKNHEFDGLERYDVVKLEDYKIDGNMGRIGKETGVKRVDQAE